MMAVLVLKIDGMSCDGCVKNIKQTLANLSGVGSCNIDLDTAQAVIVFDDGKTDADTLINAIDDLGFDVSLVKDER